MTAHGFEQLVSATTRRPDCALDHRHPRHRASTALAKVIATTGTHADEWCVINSDDFKDLLLEQARRDGSYEIWPLRGELGELGAAGERLWPP